MPIVGMLNVDNNPFTLSVVMLSDIMLNVVMLSVMALFRSAAFDIANIICYLQNKIS